MQASARMTGAYFRFRAGQKIVLCLSPDSIGGKMLIVRALVHDMELIVVDLQRNPLEKIDFSVDFAAMVPMQVQETLDINPAKLDLVRQILIGGATVTPDLAAQLRNVKASLFESFGMTETVSHVAIRRLNQDTEQPFEALQGITFSTHEQQLVIHAPQLGQPDLQTNDVVELAGPHAFFWKGRADFVINSGGIKFHPEILESKLAPFIAQRFFIAGEADVTLGEKIILLLETGSNEIAESDLQEIYAAQLDRYEIPKKTYFVKAFQETVSGKVNRITTQKEAGI